jgi:hypothetical protein
MLLSDSVGGADDSRKGFSKRIPVNVVDRSAIVSPFREALIIDSRPMRRLLSAFLLVATPLLAQTPAQQARPTEQPKPAPEKPQPAPPPIVTPTEAQKPNERPLTVLPYTPSLDIPSMDRTADPCVDFYQYTCGGWMKNNPIPPDQASWSVYGKLAEENGEFLWGILEQNSSEVTDRTPIQQKIGDYFESCMDESRIEALGATPLQPLLEEIAGIKSKRDLARFLAVEHPRDYGSGWLFGLRPRRRARSARSRLLHQDGREIERDPRQVSAARGQHASADRRVESRRAERCRICDADRD